MIRLKWSRISRQSRTGRKGLKAALLAIMAFTAVSWGTSYTSWTYYRTVTLTPTADVSAAVTNFPLLVKLTSANADVFAASRSDGLDIRFTTSDGATDLAFQREYYNSTTQKGQFWVMIPSVAANPAVTTIRMYYGNSAATTDAQSAAATFSTAAGSDFRAVWHLSAAVGANEPDATGSGHDLVQTGSPTDTLGPAGIGKAKLFDGATQFFTANNSGGSSSTLNFPAGGPLTISAWINPGTLQTGKAVLGKINTGNVSTWTGSYGWCFNGSTAGQLRGSDANPGAGFERCQYTLTANTWTHLVWVRNGTGATLTNSNFYVNGVAAGATTSNNTSSLVRVDSLPFCVGKDPDLSGISQVFWAGALSEIQVSSAAWTPARIALNYQTQLSTSSVVAFGSATQIGTAPTPPLLSSPSNNAQNQATALTLAWSSVATATGYAVQVSTSTAFATTVTSQSSLTGLSAAISGLSYSTTYYWQARASNGTGSGNWSAAWTFATMSAPAAPALVTPTNSATSLVTTMTLTWGTVANAASYGVQVSTSSAFASTVLSQASLTAATTTFTGVIGNTYYWHANATNSVGSSAWSNTWAFAISLPAAPALSAPTNNAAVVAQGGNQTLSWAAVSGARNYTVQLSTSSAFASTLLNTVVTTTTQAVTGLKAVMYYWRVADSAGPSISAWSPTWSFSVSTPVLAGQVAQIAPSFKVMSSFIEYSIPAAAKVHIAFTNMLGRTALEIDRAESAGMHKLSFNKLALTPGRYIVTMKMPGMEKKVPLTLSR